MPTALRVRAVIAVVLGVGLLQALWITVLPSFRAIDEFDHAYRASAVAHGQWVATETTPQGRGLLVNVPPDLVEAAHGQCASLGYTGPANCSPLREEPNGLVAVASGAGGYHPAYYWVVGQLARPFHGASADVAMRVASGALSLIFVGVAVWVLTRRARSRQSLIAALIAMSPMLIFSTVVPAPNGLEMAAALAMWAALFSLLDGDDPRVARGFVALTTAGVVLATVRLLGPGFVVLILAIGVLAEPRRAIALWRGRRSAVLFAGGVLGVAMLAAAAWTLGLTASGTPTRELPAAWSDVFLNIALWQMQAVAAFPFRDQLGPMISYAVIGALAVALVTVAWRFGDKRRRLVLAVTAAVPTLLPLALVLATNLDRVNSWQGRYGLPLAVGCLLIAGFTLDRKVELSARTQAWGAGAVIALLMVGQGAALLRVRGEEVVRPASVADPSWHPPAVWLVVAVCLVSAACFWVAVVEPRRKGAAVDEVGAGA